MRSLLTKLYICFIVLSLVIPVGVLAAGEDEAALRARIDERNKELQQINQEIAQTQLKLQATQTQKQSLSTEVSRINSNLKQITLGIRSSEVAVEKYGLEIEDLRDDIAIAENDISQKEVAVSDLLRQIQQQDAEGLLFVLLKNDALSDSLFEMQALKDMYDTLTVKIDEMNQSKNALENVLATVSGKRTQKETEALNLKSKMTIAAELKKDKEVFLTSVKNQEQVYTQYMDDLTAKQLKIAQEIVEIESKLTDKIDYGTLPDKMPGLLASPLMSGSFRITQEYGRTAFAVRVYKSGFHNGIDLGAPLGTPIYASEAGVVLAAANQDLYCRKGAYGKFVVIKHSMGLTTLYAHMSMINTKKGATVKKGDLIGYVGTTGLATGPHLHYTLYDSKTFYIGNSVSCGPEMPFGGHIPPRNYVSF